jgi:hypothetical protein
MGRKKRTVVALKPFCYYCDKEFNNEIILHQHQKARHFNCRLCRKRFSTGPALDTHVFQVHKERLHRVPNAKAGRDTFDISIYGMDGVPLELINLKLVEKVASKKRKLIRENKLIADEEDLKEEKNQKGKKKKDKRGKFTDKSEIDMKSILGKGTGFYHNPDSINLTLNSNQMSSMYNQGMGNQTNVSMNFTQQMGTDQMYTQQMMQQQMMNPMAPMNPMMMPRMPIGGFMPPINTSMIPQHFTQGINEITPHEGFK